MTTKVTFMCHGPDAIRITPKVGGEFAGVLASESIILKPGQFHEGKYVYQGLSFVVEEVAGK